jgi:hypothetical protein
MNAMLDGFSFVFWQIGAKVAEFSRALDEATLSSRN